MNTLRVTDEELFILLDAVNLLQSACVYAHNNEDLIQSVGKLASKIVDCYTGK